MGLGSASRRGRRVLAAVLALVICAGALDWGHTRDDDPTCSRVPVRHDHAAHRLSTAPSSSSTPSGDHCYICHSLKLLHTTLVVRSHGAAPTIQVTGLGQPDEVAVPGAVGAAVSSRAPPAAFL